MENYLEQQNQVIKFAASYNTSLPEEYASNPLLCALPAKLSKKDFIDLVTLLPKFTDEHLEYSANYRMKKVAELYSLVIPTSHYYQMYSIFEQLLFTSYSERNPMLHEVKLAQYSLAAHKTQMKSCFRKMSGQSFVYTGPSGIGKSTLINRVAQAFPQVIIHSEFENRPFKQAQIVWIKVKIPSDAARKSFAILFLEEVDRCIGTTYATDNKNISIGNYESLFRTIVSTFKVGMLIVDDLQSLSIAKSGGDDAFLNFFSSLCDDLGVALVLVGTPNCTSVLTKTFTGSRRLTSAGDLHRERFTKTNKNWLLLVSKLWNYQYVNTPSELTKVKDNKRVVTNQKLFDEIYNLTQGVPFILFFLFVQAQLMAIEKPSENGEEVLSLMQLRKAYHQGSALIKGAIEAIKNGDVDCYKDMITQAENEHSPIKTQYIQNLMFLLDAPNISRSVSNEISRTVDELEAKFILKKKELDLILRAKSRLNAIEIKESNVLDGEYKEVSI